MKTARKIVEVPAGPWDEEHIKALLHFPRFPVHLIHQEPWQTWILLHGDIKAVYTYLRNYPLSPSHHRILEVVLSSPEEISDVYANRLYISRATYFYQLRELLPALVLALNHWEINQSPDRATQQEFSPPSFSSLPYPLNSLVGAEDILNTLTFQLQREEVRLLTLLGPGGIGKTRVSIELARRMCTRLGNNIGFVDLSPFRDPGSVAPAIAQALGIQEGNDLQALIAFLTPREFLLVLDNFEHLLSVSALVTELLAAAPRLKILITSRIALRVYGEHEFIVPPLASPSAEMIRDPDQLARSPSVALFLQRAEAVNPGFTLDEYNAEAVFELCLRMEGIPLAIELAAFQVKYFSPQAMLVRLSNSKRLNFLSQGPKRLHPHQQSPRDILDWSYELLTPELQMLFRRLSIFAGGCTMEAANTVCALLTRNGQPPDRNASRAEDQDGIARQVQAGLTSLVDQSLLQQQSEPNGEPRFYMLEITREYAREQLDAQGETQAVERAHALWYLAFAEKIRPATELDIRHTWVGRLQREYVNIKAAIQWTIDQQEGELGLRYIATLWNFWKFCGYQQDCRQITQTILAQTANLHQPLRAQVLRLSGWLAHDLRDFTAMLGSFQASFELSSLLDDRAGVGLARLGLGALAQLRGQWDLARDHAQICLQLFRELDDPRQLAWSIDLMGRIELGQGNLPEAQRLFQESLAHFRSLGSQAATAFVLSHLGQATFYQGDIRKSQSLLEESLELSNATGDTRSPVVAMIQNYLAEIAIHTKQLSRSRELINQCLALCKDTGYTWCTELGNYTAGLLALEEGDIPSARGYFQTSLSLQQSLKEHWRSIALLEIVACLLVIRQEWLAAGRLYGAAINLRNSLVISALPVYRSLHEQSLQQLRNHLKAETLDEAWNAGQSLSLDQAVIYALRCVE
jgi:predicted ATPase